MSATCEDGELIGRLQSGDVEALGGRQTVGTLRGEVDPVRPEVVRGRAPREHAVAERGAVGACKLDLLMSLPPRPLLARQPVRRDVVRDVIDQVELSNGGGDRAPRRLAGGGREERMSVATAGPLRKLFLHLRSPIRRPLR